MKLYLGTTNDAKVKAIKEVFNSFEVIPLAVESNVSNQPKSDKETIKGALNRAKNLPHGLRIGLEAGVQIEEGILFLTNFGVLIDEDDNIYYAGGTRIPLPDFVKKGIEEGKELADIMAEHLNDKDVRSRDGAIGYFTDNQVNRVDIFIHIGKLLYGQYLHRRKQ